MIDSFPKWYYGTGDASPGDVLPGAINIYWNEFALGALLHRSGTSVPRVRRLPIMLLKKTPYHLKMEIEPLGRALP